MNQHIDMETERFSDIQLIKEKDPSLAPNEHIEISLSSSQTRKQLSSSISLRDTIKTYRQKTFINSQDEDFDEAFKNNHAIFLEQGSMKEKLQDYLKQISILKTLIANSKDECLQRKKENYDKIIKTLDPIKQYLSQVDKQQHAHVKTSIQLSQKITEIQRQREEQQEYNEIFSNIQNQQQEQISPEQEELVANKNKICNIKEQIIEQQKNSQWLGKCTILKVTVFLFSFCLFVYFSTQPFHIIKENQTNVNNDTISITISIQEEVYLNKCSKEKTCFCLNKDPEFQIDNSGLSDEPDKKKQKYKLSTEEKDKGQDN